MWSAVMNHRRVADSCRLHCGNRIMEPGCGPAEHGKTPSGKIFCSARKKVWLAAKTRVTPVIASGGTNQNRNLKLQNNTMNTTHNSQVTRNASRSGFTALLCSAAVATGMFAAPEAHARTRGSGYYEYTGTATVTLSNPTDWSRSSKVSLSVKVRKYDYGRLTVGSTTVLSAYKGGFYIDTSYDSWSPSYAWSQLRPLSGYTESAYKVFQKNTMAFSPAEALMSNMVNTAQSPISNLTDPGLPTIFNWSTQLKVQDMNAGTSVNYTIAKDGSISVFVTPPIKPSSGLFSYLLSPVKTYVGGYVENITVAAK
jgi:hypothetical protein